MLWAGDSGLRPPASGVRSWGLFLDLTQRQRFRPTEKATRAAQVLRALEHLRGLLSLPRSGMRLNGDERQLAGHSGSRSHPRPLKDGRPVLHAGPGDN